MLKINTDLHTHTVASGHAYSTVDEMAKGAFTKGIKLIAVTDHGPQMPGGPHKYHFGNFSIVPDKLYGVRIIKGVEANILDEGTLDLDAEELARLEFVSAGIHRLTGHNLKNKNDYTAATIKAMENPYLDMITHPVQKEYPIDLEKVARAAAENNVILELNASSYSPKKDHTRGIKSESLRLLRLAKKYGFKLAVNSDAHFHDEIGEYSSLNFIFESEDFETGLIINRSQKNVINYLKKREKRLSELKKTV
ncbi:putative hydrolase [Halanaerobium saccharolyticum]|uniref:Putative hydrolase n=1 Tax=Halanaerobium saccharolyticum TaxID=43595 RepID=A0A4R7Z6S8_9FIRM|nr:phosphatase [Halanaerobium saccharolyticum]RAK10630.1 putative hydrolase [Halanaerobium saccharolyticum]TDW06613.1 putative hydrolase [Halanaerobium saccharolyticum]TDX62248.1 putative hydrolase [Halanaerobium saccharolyticum]